MFHAAGAPAVEAVVATTIQLTEKLKFNNTRRNTETLMPLIKL